MQKVTKDISIQSHLIYCLSGTRLSGSSKEKPGVRRRRNSLPTGRNLEQDLDEEDPPADSLSCSGVWKCLYDSG